MLAMAVVVPVVVMSLIGAAVGLLLRWRFTRFALAAVGVVVVSGAVWTAATLLFLALFGGNEGRVRWPDDLPQMLSATLVSGSVALLPALLVGGVRWRRKIELPMRNV